MVEFIKLCKEITTSLFLQAQNATLRDRFGLLGFLQSQTNANIRIAPDAPLPNGELAQTFAIQYQAADCTEQLGDNAGLCEGGAGQSMYNNWRSRQLVKPKTVRGTAITLDGKVFMSACFGAGDGTGTKTEIEQRMLDTFTTQLGVQAQNLLRLVDKRLLYELKANVGAWVNGDYNPQDLTIFSECDTTCNKFTLNPLLGLRRQKQLFDAKLGGVNSVFLGGFASDVIGRAKGIYNDKATGDISAATTINSLPTIVQDVQFDDVFGTGSGTSEASILEVNGDLIGFNVISRALKSVGLRGARRAYTLQQVIAMIGDAQIAGNLDATNTDMFLPVLVPYLDGNGNPRSILMDLHVKMTRCEANWNANVQLSITYSMEVLPAAELVCGVSPAYTGIVEHSLAYPCEPASIVPAGCDAKINKPLCLSFKLPECGLVIKAGTTVVGTSGAVVDSFTYPNSWTATTPQNLAGVLNAVFQGQGIGAFAYNATTGYVNYYPSLTGLVSGTKITLSAADACFADLVIDIIQCPSSPNSGVVAGSIEVDVNGAPTAFVTDVTTNCTGATFGFTIVETATGFIDYSEYTFATVEAAYAAYLVAYTSAAYPAGTGLTVTLQGTCVAGSALSTDYTVLAIIGF